MACQAITTGAGFLSATLAQVDCQASAIGNYGFGAMASPGSPIATVLSGALTLFVALFGMRLALGYAAGTRDVVGIVLRIGIVLTLTMSWPAWRVIGYDVILDGPAEIADTVVTGAGLAPASSELRARLQRADDGLVAMTATGTGRLPGSDLRDPFRGIAIEDQTGFGWGRLLFLVATIGPFAIVRLGAGILLALAPLLALFLLFGRAFGLFQGWIRGLCFVAVGSLCLTLVQGLSLALLEPWIADVISQRATGAFTPASATEMTALSFVYAIASAGMLALVARMTFFPSFADRPANRQVADIEWRGAAVSPDRRAEIPVATPPGRAASIAAVVERSVRREERHSAIANGSGFAPSGVSPDSYLRSAGHFRTSYDEVGSGHRRANDRRSPSKTQRDRTL